jgi:RHS repeat-associated protein
MEAHIGNPAAPPGAGGSAVPSHTYDVFGAPKAKTGTADTPFRFTAERQDSQVARGPYYLRARYYDPATGRFLSRDPIPFIQRYAYVANNPVNVSDPYGYFPPSPGDIAGSLWNAGRCAANPVACARSKVDEVLVDPLLGSLPGGGAVKCIYHHGAARCAAEWALGQLGFDRSYVDLNVTTGCGGVLTAGTQLSLQGGAHVYAGAGVSNSCGITGSITVGPRQSISSGWAAGYRGATSPRSMKLPASGPRDGWAPEVWAVKREQPSSKSMD